MTMKKQFRCLRMSCARRSTRQWRRSKSLWCNKLPRKAPPKTDVSTLPDSRHHRPEKQLPRKTKRSCSDTTNTARCHNTVIEMNIFTSAVLVSTFELSKICIYFYQYFFLQCNLFFVTRHFTGKKKIVHKKHLSRNNAGLLDVADTFKTLLKQTGHL